MWGTCSPNPKTTARPFPPRARRAEGHPAPAPHRRRRLSPPPPSDKCGDGTLGAFEIPDKPYKLCLTKPKTAAPAVLGALSDTTPAAVRAASQGGAGTAATAAAAADAASGLGGAWSMGFGGGDGASARAKAYEKMRQDDEKGRQARGIGCGGASSKTRCSGRQACIAGVCVPCGGQDAPCCVGRRAQCWTYDTSTRLQCVQEGQGVSMCRLPAGAASR
jgi:hypothetical protein